MKTQSPISVTLPNCAITHYWIAFVIDMGIFMKEKISCIYKIQSIIKPERIYIGSAVDVFYRWVNHRKCLRNKRHENSKLQNHFNKYGESDFIFSVLLSCEKEDLIKHEQFFIDAYNPFFNICKLAGSTLGLHFKHSEETKIKYSKAKKGQVPWNKGKKGLYKHSEEAKLKIKKSWETRPPMSDETRLKYSKVKIGKKFTEEHKRKMSEWQIGKKLTEETKINISNSLKGKKQSEETKAKIAKAMIGNKNRMNPQKKVLY